MSGHGRRYWPAESFPSLSLKWFGEYGAQDPESAFWRWTNWIQLGDHTNDAKLKKALALVVGVAPASVDNYLSQYRNSEKNRADRLRESTLRHFDDVIMALGVPLPTSRARTSTPSRNVLVTERGGRRIAVLAQLSGVPSPRYHLEVLDGIIRAGAKVNFSIAVYSMQARDPDLAGTVQRLIRSNNPHAIVWFRVGPDPRSLQAMQHAGVPAVVVHGQNVRYPPPTIAHILPCQTDVSVAVRGWLDQVPPCDSVKTVVIAAMRDDEVSYGFQLSELNRPVGLRQERIDAVKEGVVASGFRVAIEYVSDYAGPQAFELVQRQPDALAYICLSDEIAIAVRQILTARGRSAENRVLGFDGSELARRYSIPTINQHLDDIGHQVTTALTSWFGRKRTSNPWPTCEERRIPQNLLGAGDNAPET